MEKLLLIDAYSQIFRSFYAIRHLTNRRGEPVNAAFVFAKLLLKLEKRYPERRSIMLFDSGKVAFRLELAPEYKANRPPMPDELKSQMPLIKRIAAAFGWNLFSCEGYEADDLIGMIALKCREDSEVLIVSSDKDLSQLVGTNISMLVPQSGTKGDFEERGHAEVIAKFGVAPELMVDYLALLGDSSDNISGVPGIGPKSAAELLNTFGGADKWLDDPASLASSRFYKKLEGNFELLKRNRELIRLRTAVIPELEAVLPGMLKKSAPDWKEIADICQDNQFASILKELPGGIAPAEEMCAAETTVDDEVDLFSFCQSDAAEVSAPEAGKMEKNQESCLQQPELF